MNTFIIFTALASTQIFAAEIYDNGREQVTLERDQRPIGQNSSQITYYSNDTFPDTLDNDPRLVRSASSPTWLAAVGRSISNTSSTDKEQCTISIIADSPEKDGIIAITAGHCVDHWVTGNGTFKIGPNETVFTSNSGKVIKRSIAKVLKAELYKGDYAIVKLNAAIDKEDIKPLLNAPYHYSDLLDKELFHKPYATMAGYSADKGKGKKGKVLTYHEKCQLNGGGSGQKKGYCYSYRGASGGPVVVTVALGDMADEPWQEQKQSYFVGSILGARGGDNNSKTLFTDTTHYTRILDKILASH